MQNQRILSWEEFRYLNGVRRNNIQIMQSYEEYLLGLKQLKIISQKGKINDDIGKVLSAMAELNVSLSALVQKERVKDITLYLEDL
jgi:hypothetical protein